MMSGKKTVSGDRATSALGSGLLVLPEAPRGRRVIAVDPGGTTGIATWDGAEFRAWERECWDAVDDVAVMLKQPTLAVVAEAYVITRNTLKKGRGENWSLESIGALRWLARRAGVLFETQPATGTMELVPDRVLRQLEMWVPGKQHARDALRHLVRWMIDQRIVDPRSLL